MDTAITIIMILFPINWGEGGEEIFIWCCFPGRVPRSWIYSSQKLLNEGQGKPFPLLFIGTRDIMTHRKVEPCFLSGEEAETWASFGRISSHVFHPQSTHESVIVLGVAKNPNSKYQDGQAPCKDVGVGVGVLACIFWLVEVCGVPTSACCSITQNLVFFFTKPSPWTFRFTSVSSRTFTRSASTQSSRISQSVS